MKLIRFAPLVCVAALLLSVPALAEEPPVVSAASYVLMDADSGRVLSERNCDEPRLIASTTKIMTALLVLERCDPDAVVEIDPAWTGIEGSTMYLASGQVMTVRDLLYGLMLASGNDAAVALACITAGDVDAFADLMNERAAELGCRNTHFENPNGLDGEEHYASARDLALITREAIKNPEFRRIVSTTSATVGELTYTNHNRLLRECEGVFGVKTGYTEAAGRTLVTCCERDGITLICVTLTDPDDWLDHAAMYDWAYDEYVLDDVVQQGSGWTLPVIGGVTDSVTALAEHPLPVLHREGESVSVLVRLPSFVYADVLRGDNAGSVTAFVDGTEVASAALIYGETVERECGQTRDILHQILSLPGLAERNIYALT